MNNKNFLKFEEIFEKNKTLFLNFLNYFIENKTKFEKLNNEINKMIEIFTNYETGINKKSYFSKSTFKFEEESFKKIINFEIYK